MSSLPPKPRLVVSRTLPRGVEQRLVAAFDTQLAPPDGTGGDLVARASAHHADALLVCLTDAVSADLIARLPASVRVIATYSVGHNHIDVDAARARGIAVTSTPQAVTAATADCALLLLLGACRMAAAFQRQMQAGEWIGWTATGLLGMDPGGKVLGIVGLGRIGRAVAQRARAFGMEIHYHGRHRLDPELEQDATYHPSLEGLFRASQVVSLHTPSVAATRGMINGDSLAWLAPGAVFINTARGDQVVDDDLIAALRSGQLRAAGLDVFANEPDFDRRYLDLPNVFLLPHIGTSTHETRDRMGADAVADLTDFFAGREPRGRVG